MTGNVLGNARFTNVTVRRNSTVWGIDDVEQHFRKTADIVRRLRGSEVVRLSYIGLFMLDTVRSHWEEYNSHGNVRYLRSPPLAREIANAEAVLRWQFELDEERRKFVLEQTFCRHWAVIVARTTCRFSVTSAVHARRRPGRSMGVGVG